MSKTLQQLNDEFSFHDGVNSLRFCEGEGGIPVIEIHNEQVRATISLQGAHLLSWVPSGGDDVIWLSDEASFGPGKSIRGGIPVCWPWFGAHEMEKTFPAHGFARTVLWDVKETEELSDDETRITFRLDTSELDEQYRHMWPVQTVLEYRLTLSKTLTLELTTSNQCDHTINITQALHTYFRVSDVSKVCVFGLEDKEYLDKTLGFKRMKQEGQITIDTEIDRIYLDTDDDVIIDDSIRKIIIKKEGSHSTVVWNPWESVAAKMGDLGKEGYRNMLCVESSNAADDKVNIRAGEQHTLRVTYELEVL